MYRESLFGAALAATLAELEAVCHLSAGQRGELWDVFDRAMDRTLAEAPALSRVRVFAPPPTLREEIEIEKEREEDGAGGGGGLSTTEGPVSFPISIPIPTTTTSSSSILTSGARGSTAAVIPRCDVLDDGTTYPVYRVHDGMWTILLKGPSVEVKDGAGHTETIQLDYLKVHLKDVSQTDVTKATSTTMTKTMTTAGKKRRR